MFLKHITNGELVEVIDLQDVINPHTATIRGRGGFGTESMQKITDYLKEELVFPSGEELPQCWIDQAYRVINAA